MAGGFVDTLPFHSDLVCTLCFRRPNEAASKVPCGYNSLKVSVPGDLFDKPNPEPVHLYMQLKDLSGATYWKRAVENVHIVSTVYITKKSGPPSICYGTMCGRVIEGIKVLTIAIKPGESRFIERLKPTDLFVGSTIPIEN